ncbi:hypothetical protein JDV02_003160 [Purpureocillium takamizusanense]|uniref:Uncharacterized protein n=1 Tax=Purpureocillium takamizusanense TaxID=2060973 RepID=A0A9Q8QCJ8_9HYPO|nr:uncharacterized protein JDV02_003160 [Purpureocillium takamizusanense]UNI16752.1 hypothetical protein JDV02_003160 [Purpureocillium takamizusanense]
MILLLSSVANVTHGVFRPSAKLDNLFDSFEPGPVRATDGFGMRKLEAFAKFMPKTPVWIDLLLANGMESRKAKTVRSIVTASEFLRRRLAAERPLWFAPGYECLRPKQVEFFLSDNAGGGKHTTIVEYFRESTFSIDLAQPILLLQSTGGTSKTTL